MESVAAQPEVDELIVVNDQSADRTEAILSELAARIPKLKVLNTEELLAGWVGKNYAASMGAAAADGDWLLFTDADTDHLPSSTRRALADADDHDAVLVSYSPEQEMETFWERALVPFVYCRLAARFPYTRVNDPALPDAAANGQYLMVRRDVYWATGGHAAVSGEILEDVALARRLKKAGYRIYFAAPIGVVRTRMYRSFGALWQGWTKNLFPLMGRMPYSMSQEVLAAFPVLEIILAVLLWVYVLRRHGAPAWYLAVLLAGVFFVREMRYAADLYRNLFRISYIKYYVPGAFLYVAVLITSWWKIAHGAVVWKGRRYPARVHPGSS